jgi:uncharacterized metal-binding protein YceD (DUF177 family)
VNTLTFSLADILDEGSAVEATVTADEIRPEGAADLGLGPVAVRGELIRSDDMAYFRGEVETAYRGPCDRCVKEVEWPFTQKVLWTFIPRLKADVEEEWEVGGTVQSDGTVTTTVGFDGTEVYLGLQVWEELALSAPIKFPPLAEDQRCCAVCGEDVEQMAVAQGHTDDEEHLTDNGFAALKDLFPDETPKAGKE